MSNSAPGNHRPTLMAAWGKATRFHRRRILTLCEERIYVFSRLVPWPALAESWQTRSRHHQAGGGMRETPRDLAGRIKAFYDANPGELLTLADLCAKFEVTPDRAKGSLDSLRRRGEVGAMVVYGRMWGEA